jgi:hypothetical protein
MVGTPLLLLLFIPISFFAHKNFPSVNLDKLYRQHGMHRDPSHELRSVCFIALKMALDSKRSNLISLGLNGMHVRRMKIYEKTFHIEGFSSLYSASFAMSVSSSVSSRRTIIFGYLLSFFARQTALRAERTRRRSLTSSDSFCLWRAPRMSR